MLPLDLMAARKALEQKKIRMKDYLFLDGVHKQDSITEKQYKYIIDLAEAMLPHELLPVKHKTTRAPVDEYFNQRYYPDEY